MCAGGGGTGGGGTGQSAGYSPWMGYGGGMSQQSPMGSGQLQSAGMGMGAPMQRQSPYMGSGGFQNQAAMPKVDKFYTGAPEPMLNQSQMGRVDRFAGTGGPMPTGDVFGAQQGPMGAQGAYAQMSAPMNAGGYSQQGPAGSFSSAGTPYGMPTGTFGGGGSGQQGPAAYGSPMDLQTSQLQRAMSPWMQQAGGQQGYSQQSPWQSWAGGQGQQAQTNPNFQQLMAALQGMGGRQV